MKKRIKVKKVERKDYNADVSIPFWQEVDYDMPSQHKQFYERYGFYPEEIYSLDYTIARFVLPRLRYFRENATMGTPSCFFLDGYIYRNSSEEDKRVIEKRALEKWQETLDKMIYAFEHIANENKWWITPVSKQKEQDEKIDEGLELFGKYFRHLWC